MLFLMGGGGGASINYSTSEQDTGRKWINGGTVYQKTIAFGALPNTTTKTVAHGITGTDAAGFKVLAIECVGHVTSSGLNLPVPFAHQTDASSMIELRVDLTNIDIRANSNQSGVNETYVTLLYVKDADA